MNWGGGGGSCLKFEDLPPGTRSVGRGACSDRREKRNARFISWEHGARGNPGRGPRSKSSLYQFLQSRHEFSEARGTKGKNKKPVERGRYRLSLSAQVARPRRARIRLFSARHSGRIEHVYTYISRALSPCSLASNTLKIPYERSSPSFPCFLKVLTRSGNTLS